MTTAVPIIDISGFATGDEPVRARIAQEVSSALEEIGFLVIQGHDVDPKTITAARDLARRFFDLPLPDKIKSRKPTKGSYRGYVTADDENLSYMQNEASPPDLKEFFGFGHSAMTTHTTDNRLPNSRSHLTFGRSGQWASNQQRCDSTERWRL